MGFVDLSEGPDGLRARAVQLSGHAEDFATRLETLLTRISEVEGGKPWGGDKYGEQFERSYGQETDEGPLNRAVDAQVATLGPEASTLGEALTAGATDYQSEDLQAADDINKLGGTA